MYTNICIFVHIYESKLAERTQIGVAKADGWAKSIFVEQKQTSRARADLWNSFVDFLEQCGNFGTMSKMVLF